MNVKRPLQPYVWMLASSFAFSWMGTLTQLAGQGCSWQMTAIVRCVMPLVLVAVWSWAAGARLVLWGPPTLWMRSLAGSCSLVGTFYALHRLQLTEVYTISNMFPIWVALLSWPMLGRPPALSVWFCVLSGVAGVALIMQPRFADGDLTVLIVVANSVFTSLAMMGLHNLKHLDPRAIVVHFSATALAFAIGAILLLPASPTPEDFDLRHVAMLLGVGISATVGQYFLTLAFTSGEPARMSVVSLTQIVFVIVWQLTVLGEPLKSETLLGMPLIFLGIPLILGPSAWLMYRQLAHLRPMRDAVRLSPALGADMRFAESGRSTLATDPDGRERAK
jgi:drug/metabolite transporter (DMT)-like permease